MKKLKDVASFIRFEYDILVLKRVSKIISQIENGYCLKQHLDYKDIYKIAFIVPGMVSYSG